MNKLTIILLTVMLFSCTPHKKVIDRGLTDLQIQKASELQTIKDCIVFDHTEGIGLSLVNLVDLWYLSAIDEGKTHKEAVIYSAKELSERIHLIINVNENN